jgi:hypothetical protein
MCQWRKNGSNISAANASSYTIASVTAGDTGSNDSGTYSPAATSTAATLTVKQLPPDPSTVARVTSFVLTNKREVCAWIIAWEDIPVHPRENLYLNLTFSRVVCARMFCSSTCHCAVSFNWNEDDYI